MEIKLLGKERKGVKPKHTGQSEGKFGFERSRKSLEGSRRNNVL